MIQVWEALDKLINVTTVVITQSSQSGDTNITPQHPQPIKKTVMLLGEADAKIKSYFGQVYAVDEANEFYSNEIYNHTRFPTSVIVTPIVTGDDKPIGIQTENGKFFTLEKFSYNQDTAEMWRQFYMRNPVEFYFTVTRNGQITLHWKTYDNTMIYFKHIAQVMDKPDHRP